MNPFFVLIQSGISYLLYRIRINKSSLGTNTTTIRAALEFTGNTWIREHDTLEEDEIDGILANPYKTKIITEAREIRPIINNQKNCCPYIIHIDRYV